MNTTVDSPYQAPITFLYAADRFRTLYSTAMSVCIQKFNYHVERGDTVFSLPITGMTFESLCRISDGFLAEFLSLLDWPEGTVTVTKREDEDSIFLDVIVDLNLLLLAASPMQRTPLIEGPEHEACLRIEAERAGEELPAFTPVAKVLNDGDVFPPSFGVM